MSFTLKELADKVGAAYNGDGDVVIESVAPIDSARAGQITFLSNPAYKKFLSTTKASAIVVSPEMTIENCSTIVSESPYLTFSRIVDLLCPPPYEESWGIHATAVISESACVPEKAQIGPHVVIEDYVVIGKGAIIGAGTFIGKKTAIGKNCRIAPNVSILHGGRIGDNAIIHAGTVIGADGFGFAPTGQGEEYKKIRQVGWVEIGDSVEIGANVTIDRGAIGPTVIESGVKIDNLVQIAHNVRIGENSIIVAQVGISGSTKLGKSVILAGQAGLAGHLEIGDGVIIGAQAGVGKSLEGSGQIYTGYPARPIKELRRMEAAMRQLPELLKRVSELEDKFKDE